VTATYHSETKMPRFDFMFPARAETTRTNGEPDWMPSPEEVTRARGRLQREGVLSDFTGLPPEPLVPMGATPWLWWVAAVLWLVIWPVAVVARLRFSALDWFPMWVIVALAVVHMAALAAPVLYSERQSGNALVRRRFAMVGTLPEMLALGPGEFEAWTGMLFRLLGYRVLDTQLTADHGIDLVVTSTQMRRGLVQCKRYRGTVGEHTVRDLYGTMTHENAEFAWLVTTGAISRQAREWAEGKPIALWDGRELTEMARRYR
jgi:restriction system protein